MRGIVSEKGQMKDILTEPFSSTNPEHRANRRAMPRASAQLRDPMHKTRQKKAPSPDDAILQGRKRTPFPKKTRSNFHMLFFWFGPLQTLYALCLEYLGKSVYWQQSLPSKDKAGAKWPPYASDQKKKKVMQNILSSLNPKMWLCTLLGGSLLTFPTNSFNFPHHNWWENYIYFTVSRSQFSKQFYINRGISRGINRGNRGGERWRCWGERHYVQITQK